MCSQLAVKALCAAGIIDCAGYPYFAGMLQSGSLDLRDVGVARSVKQGAIHDETVLLMRNLSRSCLCRIALIAIGFGISGYVGHAQDTAKAGLSTRNNVEFLGVKIRAAQMQPELSRLDQELETFAARLKDRSDLSPTTKASAISQVEQARAVLRSHAETLRRAAANLTDWTTAGQEIDALAEMLNMQGDQTLRAVTDEIARHDGNADQLVTSAATYQTAVTQLVEAARKAREHSQVVGGGGGDKR
jgi:ABC-type transporter Mla subunit MlaD